MNTTPRWLNRTILIVLGLILIAAGVIAIALAVSPDFRDGWAGTGPDVHDTVAEFWAAWLIPGLGYSWWWIVLLVVLVVLIALAVLVTVRQGGGGASRLLNTAAPDGAVPGEVIINTAVAEQALTSAIAQNPDVVSVHVTGRRLKKQAALKITIVARKGASPARIASAVQSAIAKWDALFGEEVPVVVEIVSGIRTSTSQALRTQ